MHSFLSIAPIGVFVGSATTGSITVAVQPPQLPGEIRHYDVVIGSMKCQAQAGPATPSCALSGLVAGKLYNASATSVGDDSKKSFEVFGTVNTLPNGKGLGTLPEKIHTCMPYH